VIEGHSRSLMLIALKRKKTLPKNITKNITSACYNK